MTKDNWNLILMLIITYVFDVLHYLCIFFFFLCWLCCLSIILFLRFLIFLCYVIWQDIQIRGVNRDEKNIQMAKEYPNSKHFLTYRHSLRVMFDFLMKSSFCFSNWCLILGSFIIRFEMLLLPLFLRREFGKLRFLKGWLFLCGQ